MGPSRQWLSPGGSLPTQLRAVKWADVGPPLQGGVSVGSSSSSGDRLVHWWASCGVGCVLALHCVLLVATQPHVPPPPPH